MNTGESKLDITTQSLQAMGSQDLGWMFDRYTDFAYLPAFDLFHPPDNDLHLRIGSNEGAWQLFRSEDLYANRRITLDHFHIFEWFPITPGQCHTEEAHFFLKEARKMMIRTPEGSYFDPYGKMNMLRAGVGAVRFNPYPFVGENHFFMTASSSAICHEGFPVVVPNHFYGDIKGKIQEMGVAPATVSGEMRILTELMPTPFGSRRDLPQLYLVLDDVQFHHAPRVDVKALKVSVVISFQSAFEGESHYYVTYDTFNPAIRASFDEACNWLKNFYVSEKYQGKILTDFDQMHPKFPEARFGLPKIMDGKLTLAELEGFVNEVNPNRSGNMQTFINKYIDTRGGAYLDGNVNTKGGDFVGRDQIARKRNEPK